MSAANSVIVCPNAGDNGSPEVPTASILTYGGTTAPAGWLMCDGSAVSRATFANLFAAIGTTYGSGNGSTTFNVPNVGGRTIRGRNNTTYSSLGGVGGFDTVSLVANNLPPHEHRYNAPSIINFGPSLSGQSGVNGQVAANTEPEIYDNSGTQVVGPTGVGQTAVAIVNTFIILNYIIKV